MRSIFHSSGILKFVAVKPLRWQPLACESKCSVMNITWNNFLKNRIKAQRMNSRRKCQSNKSCHCTLLYRFLTPFRYRRGHLSDDLSNVKVTGIYSGSFACTRSGKGTSFILSALVSGFFHWHLVSFSISRNIFYLF